MRWEYVKSIILSTLVAISFLLTLAIWYYQPKLEELSSKSIIDETTKIADGKKETINTIIQPKQIMFHYNDRLFALDKWSKTKDLYQEMQTWPIDDFRYRTNTTFDKSSSVEVIFPTSVPIEMLTNTFTIKNGKDVPSDMKVDRMFVQVSPNQSSSLVHFVANDSNESIRAVIRNYDVYKYMEDYLSNEHIQTEYVAFEEKRKSPIYVPANEVTLTMQTYPTRQVPVNPLINVLFPDPNLVGRNSTNFGEDIYTDSSRQLRIFENQTMMQFINPNETNQQIMNRKVLIRQSLDFVNDHNGWTGDYQLYDINQNVIRYRITKNGFPVINENSLSTIQQEWRKQELFEYKRPLIQLQAPFGDQEVTLQSGRDVIANLESSWKQYPPYLIEDIAIGYSMKQTSDTSAVYTLEPAWFIKVGEWKRLKFEDGYLNQGGGK